MATQYIINVLGDATYYFDKGNAILSPIKFKLEPKYHGTPVMKREMLWGTYQEFYSCADAEGSHFVLDELQIDDKPTSVLVTNVFLGLLDINNGVVAWTSIPVTNETGWGSSVGTEMAKRITRERLRSMQPRNVGRHVNRCAPILTGYPSVSTSTRMEPTILPSQQTPFLPEPTSLVQPSTTTTQSVFGTAVDNINNNVRNVVDYADVDALLHRWCISTKNSVMYAFGVPTLLGVPMLHTVPS